MENYNTNVEENKTIYVGLDVHKNSFSMCCIKKHLGKNDEIIYTDRMFADHNEIVSRLESVALKEGEDTVFKCGYEAGCLGFSLYKELKNDGYDCVILAPTTMLATSKKRMKTDARDAMNIAKCVAYGTYSPVHVPTELDNSIKEYIRMRDDHCLALRKVKQQILSFCLRHNLRYDGSNWTQKHIKWLQDLPINSIMQTTMDCYLGTFGFLSDAINKFNETVEEFADLDPYKEKVKKLSCLVGIKTHTALSIIVEVSDFDCFSQASNFASFLGLVLGESSSGETQTRLGITKAGNSHIRRLLSESAQCFSRGNPNYIPKAACERQKGIPQNIINYCQRANQRLKRRYDKLFLKSHKPHNVAVTAVARELSCFIWGLMTNKIA